MNQKEKKAKFSIGDIVKHKHFDFRGVIYDVDFKFNNSEEWYQSIPRTLDQKKTNLFITFLQRAMKLLTKHMFLSRI